MPSMQVIGTWDLEKKARLLQFTTGTSRVPVNGFKDLQGSDGASSLSLPLDELFSALEAGVVDESSARRSSPVHAREERRHLAAPQEPYLLQPPRARAVPDLRYVRPLPPRASMMTSERDLTTSTSVRRLEQKLTFAVENTLGFSLE